MAAFNLENKIRWEDLAPSLQQRFKNLEARIQNIEDILNIGMGQKFKTWNLRMWKFDQTFTDLSFYDTMRVTQSGNINRITGKRYNCIFQNMDSYPHIYGGRPEWIKHQFVHTTSDGVSRLYLGCKGRAGNQNACIYYSTDDEGLKFEFLANIGATAIWDIAEFRNMLFIITYNPWGIWRSTDDGRNWSNLGMGINAKTLCVFKNGLYCISPGITWRTSDGINWQTIANSGVGAGHIYSRYATDSYIYVGNCNGGSAGVYRSSDGINFTYVPGSNIGADYTRWICAWTPKNNRDHGRDVEYIIWGTGASGNAEADAYLMMYDPVDNSTHKLFSFSGNPAIPDHTNHNVTLNYGHAPAEPVLSTGSGYVMGGFRESQIRYIEVYDNDYTGESFLVIGTSDCQLYSKYRASTLYFNAYDWDTNTVKPALDSRGTKITWTADDIEAWKGDNISGDQSPPTFMGNVYCVGPRDAKAFKKDDLVVTLVKHTEDTRVYSMSTFTDPDGVKWVYAGTGGGNYSGKGLLYRFGYSDMLDLIEAAKLGCIFPPRWEAIEGVNKRLIQMGSRFRIKIEGGESARECYAEIKFGFKDRIIKSAKYDPYVSLVANIRNSVNCYTIRFYPERNVVECKIKNQSFEKVVSYSLNGVINFETWQTTEIVEGESAPLMGPYYQMGILVHPGEIDTTSSTPVNVVYKYDSLDGVVDFFFAKTKQRDNILSESNKVYTHTIDYAAGERKNIGTFALESFDCRGMYFISMKQMSWERYKMHVRNQALEGSGDFVFGGNT